MSRKNAKRSTKYAIFYKSHGAFTGPYAGMLLSKTELNRWQKSGDLSFLRNDVLKSKIQIRPRRVRA